MLFEYILLGGNTEQLNMRFEIACLLLKPSRLSL